MYKTNDNGHKNETDESVEKVTREDLWKGSSYDAAGIALEAVWLGPNINDKNSEQSPIPSDAPQRLGTESQLPGSVKNSNTCHGETKKHQRQRHLDFRGQRADTGFM